MWGAQKIMQAGGAICKKSRKHFEENVACVISFVFFFSSRRRHTRFDCDWSSDVCSSDLYSQKAPFLRSRKRSLLRHGSISSSANLSDEVWCEVRMAVNEETSPKLTALADRKSVV